MVSVNPGTRVNTASGDKALLVINVAPRIKYCNLLPSVNATLSGNEAPAVYTAFGVTKVSGINQVSALIKLHPLVLI